MIHAVLFDMDGVLLDSERLCRDITRRVARQFGYEFSDEFYQTLLGQTDERSKMLWMEYFHFSFPYEAIFKTVGKEMDSIVSSGALPLKDGMPDALLKLKTQGMKMCLVTSTGPKRVHQYMQMVPHMSTLFDAFVMGGDLARGKPYPDPYIYASKLIGFPPEECIGVEDSIAGLQSLSSAGCTAVMVPDLVPYDESFSMLVHYRLENLWQLPTLIENINSEGKCVNSFSV